MPTSAEHPAWLVDTSVAVALVVGDHAHHGAVLAALDGRILGLSGHAAFETYSVLTRLPAPNRLTPTAAGHVIAANFPRTRFLSGSQSERLLGELASSGVAGGAVYDALVGAVAVEHGLPLLTRDARALGTYRALGVEVEVLS